MRRGKYVPAAVAALLLLGWTTLAGPSSAASAPTAPVVSGALQNLDGGSTANDVKLTWGAVSGATGYTVLGRNASTTSLDSSYRTWNVGTATTFTFNNQTSGNLYKWQVYATNSAGKSSFSLATYLNTAGVAQPGTGGSGWKLRFDDEFNGSALDTWNWLPFWFSDGDQQNNTHQYARNVSVSGGLLNLTLDTATTGATVVANPNGCYTNCPSGYHGYQHTYGYTTMRMCLPAVGTTNKVADWGAGWENGQNPGNTWPVDGEHDIIEAGDYPSWTVHYKQGGTAQAVHYDAPASSNYTGCHLFAVDWEPSGETFYWDNVQVGPANAPVTTSAMYPLFTLGAGSPGGAAVVGSTWKVDYVRVWQKAGQS